MKVLLTPFCFFLLTMIASAQRDTIYPCIGIPGRGLFIGRTTAGDAIVSLGPGYTLDTVDGFAAIRYRGLGITLRYDATNRFQIISHIDLTAPFNGVTPDGFIPGRSTLADAIDRYSFWEYTLDIDNVWMGEGIEIGHPAFVDGAGFIPRTITLMNMNLDRLDDKATYEYNDAPEMRAIDSLTELSSRKGIMLEDLWIKFGVADRINDTLVFRSSAGVYQPRVSPIRSIAIANGFTIHHFSLEAGHKSRVIVITRGDRVVDVTIAKEVKRSFRICGDSVIRRITPAAEDLLAMMAAYKRKTGADFDTTDEIALPWECVRFGAFCGKGGSIPIVCCIMDSLVEARNVAALSGWLRSASREIRAYGAIGLRILETKNIPLCASDAKLIAMMAAMGKKEGMIHACLYCLGENLTFAEALSERRFVDFLDGYTSNMWRKRLR